jgi:hypothetical protein
MRQISLGSIRQAVTSGEFERAQLLWNQCAAEMAEELASRRLTVARLVEVRELVEWSRVVILCERAHLQTQINRMQSEMRVTGEYGLPPSPRTPRIVAASF